MSGLLDANILVRYLTNEPPDQAVKAHRILESAGQLYLTSIIIAEVGYVLTRLYGFSREDVVDGLIDLVRRSNVEVLGLDKDLAIEALMLCHTSGRVSFTDTLLWASARATMERVVYTFDARFPADGVELRDAPPS